MGGESIINPSGVGCEKCIVGEDIVPEVDGVSYYKHHFDIHTAVIPFAGHLVHRDQPELFNQTYLSFLECSKVNK